MKQKEVKNYNLRLPAELKADITKIAQEEKRSLNSQIILAIENYLRQSSGLEKKVSQAA